MHGEIKKSVHYLAKMNPLLNSPKEFVNVYSRQNIKLTLINCREECESKQDTWADIYMLYGTTVPMNKPINFVKSQTLLSLTKYIEENINTYNIK
jgi:hypothetical protein